jgi:DinB superfamily
MGGAGMSERDDSHDLPALRERLMGARSRLARLPVAAHLDAGPVDPATGEAWHRGNVLGHTNEMLAYWTDQLRRAKNGSGTVGRDQEGAAQRRHGIDRGNAAAEAQLKLAVDEEIGGVEKLMADLTPADLDRKVIYHSRTGDREARIGELLQTLIVSHLEEHVEQLAGLD